jgi:ABC-2 type transport system ATP-binding protein
MRVGDYLFFRARLRGLSVRRAHRRVREVLTECGLGGTIRQPIGTLSQGLRRRTGLADALLAHPRILLLDDPLAGLDLVHGRQFRQLIVAASVRAAVIVSGHVLSELTELCTRFIVLREGRLILMQRVTDFPSGRAAEILGRVLTGELAPQAACPAPGGAA